MRGACNRRFNCILIFKFFVKSLIFRINSYHNKGLAVSLLGDVVAVFVFQLLRKHRPNVLQEVLLTLHDNKSLSVETLLTLLGVNCKHCVAAYF